MGPYDPPFNFGQLVDTLVRQREYTKALEERIKQLERSRDSYRDVADPGWRKREMGAALDGEIRLLREQG